MLKKYKNQFITIIEAAGFSPSDFVGEESIGDSNFPTFTMTYRNTPFIFITRNEIEDYHSFDCAHTLFAVEFPLCEYFPSQGFTTIENIYDRFIIWLNRHIREYLDEQELPDLWEQINNERPLVSDEVITDDELHPFTDEEKQQIRLSINEFKLLLIDRFEPNEAQLQIIDNRLDYISNGLDRLNRFDWRGILLSSLISISVALSLDTMKGRQLYELFRQVFSSALKYLQ
jgi:hypothetical protein